MTLTQSEAAVLLATAIFLGFTTVSLVLIGYGSGAIVFNTVGFVTALFVLATNEFEPLEDTTGAPR